MDHRESIRDPRGRSRPPPPATSSRKRAATILPGVDDRKCFYRRQLVERKKRRPSSHPDARSAAGCSFWESAMGSVHTNGMPIFLTGGKSSLRVDDLGRLGASEQIASASVARPRQV